MQLFWISLNNFSYVEQYCAFVFVEKPVFDISHFM